MADPLYFPVAGDSWTFGSGFGPRKPPKAGASSNHRGQDIRAPGGTSVIAPTDMRIISAGRAGDAGNLIQGVDSSGYTYKFMHLSQIGVKVGDTVSGGQQIGAVGSTGVSTGNHLHFGIQDSAGKYINPRSRLDGALKSGQNKLITGAKKIAEVALENFIPGGGIVSSITGLDGDRSSWFSQVIDFFTNSKLLQRIAIVFVGLVFVGGALFLLGSREIKGNR